MDEKISNLFQQWLAAFEAMQVASDETAAVKAHNTLADIEAAYGRHARRGNARAGREARPSLLP